MCQKKIFKNTVDLANSIKDAFIYLDMDNTDSLSYPESIQSMAGDFQKFQLHYIHDPLVNWN